MESEAGFKKNFILKKYDRCMPYKNKQKKLLPNAIYHVYNRGVERKCIYENSSDYKFFINLIENLLIKHSKDIKLLAFCLMPNHFHLLVKQKDKYGMMKFMRDLSCRYTYYFNRKYARFGPLFQGTYRASIIKDQRQYAVTRNYIHQNPVDICSDVKKYPYSSYKHYQGKVHLEFIKTV